MDTITFNHTFRKRTRAFAWETIRLCSNLNKSAINSIISRQLIRSATSVGANFRAVCLARSWNEKYAKYCIVVEEADECIYWLELLEQANSELKIPSQITEEINEIVKVMSSCRFRLGQKIGKHKLSS